MSANPSGQIFDISEDDLWSHLKVPVNASVESAKLLRDAIRLGKDGKKAKAYSRLNTWYATQRNDAWVLIVDDAKDADPPTSAHIRKTLCLSLRGLYLATPGDEPIQTLEDARRHAGPLVDHLIHTGDESTVSFLCDLLVSCCRGAQNLAGRGGYPLNCMLGAHTQFEFVWKAYLALAHAGPVRPKCVEAVMKLQLGLGRAIALARNAMERAKWSRDHAIRETVFLTRPNGHELIGHLGPIELAAGSYQCIQRLGDFWTDHVGRRRHPEHAAGRGMEGHTTDMVHVAVREEDRRPLNR